jgi:hypothetical protein
MKSLGREPRVPEEATTTACVMLDAIHKRASFRLSGHELLAILGMAEQKHARFVYTGESTAMLLSQRSPNSDQKPGVDFYHVPKHTTGKQTLDVRHDKKEREVFAEAKRRGAAIDEEGEEDEDFEDDLEEGYGIAMAEFNDDEA